MAKTETDKMLDEVLKDSPQHITKLLELRKAVTESRADFLDAKEHANECKKAFEGARQKIENYLKDLTEANMFDKAKDGKEVKGKGKEVKTEQTQLNPVWPFPLPDDLRPITLGDISCNEKVSSFSAMIVGSLADKGMKNAGDVEKFCCGDGKFTDPTLAKKAMDKFLEAIGPRQGCIVLNALATVKANWATPKKGKKKDWPFPVDGAIAGHTFGQVNERFPKTLTTAALAKLAEAGYSKISDLNTMTDAKELAGIVGPGPAKKLVEAVGKYVAEVK